MNKKKHKRKLISESLRDKETEKQVTLMYFPSGCW